MSTETGVRIDELPRVHSGALQLKYPHELLDYSNRASNDAHISNDVMIGELPQVHVDAPQLLQPQDVQRFPITCRLKLIWRLAS